MHLSYQVTTETISGIDNGFTNNRFIITVIMIILIIIVGIVTTISR